MTLTHRYSPGTLAQHYAAGHWTRGTLWDCVAMHPGDAIALVDRDRTWSWGNLRALADTTARVLVRHGVRRGDIVGVQLPNSAHLVVTVLALLRLGAVYHPLNPSYRFHDLSRIFEISRPVAFIHPLTFRQFDYRALAAQLGGDFMSIAIDLEAAPDLSGAEEEFLPDLSELSADDVFLIGATSGSTGAPKLYVHTQNTQKNEARVLNRELSITEADCFLASAPLTHRGALMFGLLTAITSGAAIVVLREYQAAEVLREIDAHGVTAIMAIPAQVSDLLDLIEQQPGAAHSLRIILISGAPVQPILVRRLKAALPDCIPVTGYGTSETGYSLFTRPTDDAAKMQTCGRSIPGMEVRIVDGEIHLRGAFVFSGYHANEAATRDAVDTEGWFHTGDLGELDADGYLIVTGRQKNVIIRAGLKIQAEEIEQLLSSHPKIRQSVLVPLPDERLGERAALFVVPQAGQFPTLDEVLDFLDARGVAKFKWPEKLTLIEALPVNAVGKLDRIRLRDAVR